MEELNIVYRVLAELKNNPRNAKNHPARQIARLARSIRSFGFLAPVLIDANDMILCGHGRVQAALEIGLERIPTICVDHLSEAQYRAFVIADNKISEMGAWDEQKLAIEFEAILALGGEVEITDTGFEIGEVDCLIEEAHKPEDETQADPVFEPDRVDRVARRGDLWLLGEHRLFCGDALDPVSYQVLLGDERADMIFTDPPYNLRIAGVVSGLGKQKHKDFAMASGEMSRDEFGEFLRKVMALMASHSCDGSLHYICMDWRQIEVLLRVGGGVYDELKMICVWNKGQGGMGALYRSAHEFIVIFKSGTAAHVNNVQLGAHGRNRTNVWSYPGLSSFGRGRKQALTWHPTVKNLAMVADAILDATNPGGLVLDPFGGSGTTAIAAQRTRRRAALIELDPEYCDRILRRFCDATGIEPVNAWTGERVRRKPRKGEA